jgi:hypothetical protein
LEDIEKQDITATVPKGEIAPFLKKVWDIVDSDKNKKLSTLEIKLAYDELEQVDILSKLVCTHKNEWAYDIDTIKSEAQEIYNTGMGKNPSEKLQKQVESRILALEIKMTELMFWEEAKNLAYTGEIDSKLPARVFPSTDNVHHFHPIAWVRQMKLMYYKPDIDLSDPDKWISQFTQPRPNVACYRTSVLVVENYGATSGGLGNRLTEKYENDTFKYSNVIQTIIQMSDGSVKNTGDEKMAIEYIDQQLEKGNPIVIGVDKGVYTTFNKDNTTDHFVVITGRKTDEKGLYYRFFEVGTYVVNKESKGINPNNRLYLTDDSNLIGKKPSSNTNYRLTQVRKNL